MVQAHVWPSRHHHSLALCLLPHPFFLSLLPPFLSFPLPLVVVDEKRQVGRHAIHTPPSPLCLVPCVVVGLWVWCVVVLVGTPRLYGWHQWLWLVCLATGATHHACGASGASLCGAGVHVPTPFPTHSLTHRHGTPPRHTHTHTAGGWSTLVPGVCVCVGTVLAVAAPGSPLTPPPTPSAPLHSTSPLAAAAGGGGCGGGSVGVVACVATWSTHWLCWCCPLPHPHTHTHTGWWARGGGGCVCGVAATTTVRHSHQPPPLCPLPRPVRCVCVRVSGGTRHSGALWWHARWCVAERAPCPPHPPPTLSTLVRSLLSLPIPHLPHSHTQMARLTPHTHGVVCVAPPMHHSQ